MADGKRSLRFDAITPPEALISGAVMLEQERIHAGEQRQKHLALEYFVCFAIDEAGKKLPRVEVEAIFMSMSELEIRLALHRLNAALQERNILTAQGLGVNIQLPGAAPSGPAKDKRKPPKG